MAVSGVSSNYYGSYYTYNYGYNNGLNSDSWTDSANKKTDELKESLGISDSTTTDKTGSTSKPNTATTATSTSGFLMGYQTILEDLESSASKLQVTNKDNVFAKYEAALAEQAKGVEGADDKVKKAEDEIVSSVKDLMDKYNNAISYLKKNAGFGSGLTNQMESLKRSIPSEKTLKYLGMSIDKTGNVQVNEDELRSVLKKDAGFVKDSMGGQFGIADRLGTKATSILDSSVDKIIGSSSSDKTSSSSSGSTESTGSSAASTTYGSGSNASGMSDSFKQFASFAKGGAYNLSNYYAVSMLNILV